MISKTYGYVYMLVPMSLGTTKDSKSTSGGNLVLVGEKTYFRAWVSKKPTSTSRSTTTTESEVVSLAHRLFAEAIPALQLSTLLAGRNMRLEIEEDNQATILVGKRGYSRNL